MKTRFIKSVGVAIARAAPSLGLFRGLSPEFVGMLLGPYFDLQSALAQDDLRIARSDGRTLRKMLRFNSVEGNAFLISRLSKSAEKIALANDLKSAREAFHAFSKILAKQIERAGASRKTDILQMYCPMAFESKGGIWLQNSPELSNPYFGAQMKRCGSIQSLLKAAS